jgi:hypothetical protein
MLDSIRLLFSDLETECRVWVDMKTLIGGDHFVVRRGKTVISLSILDQALLSTQLAEISQM